MAINKKLIFWNNQSNFSPPTSSTDTTKSVLWQSIVFFNDTKKIWTHGVYFSSPLDTLLLGYSVGTDTALAESDTILGAFGKIQAQLNAKQLSLPDIPDLAGTYTKVTVSAKGLVTAGSNPTTLAGYGITDAYTKTQINSFLYTDTRTITPTTWGQGSMQFGFTSLNLANGSPYADFIRFGGYGDSSGGRKNIILFKKSEFGIRQYQGDFAATTYNYGYVDYWHSGNFDPSTYSPTSHNHTLDSLSNVSITSIVAGEILKWNGTNWINNTLSEAGIAATNHNHNGTYALIAGSTSQSFSVNRLTTNEDIYINGSNLYFENNTNKTIRMRTASAWWYDLKTINNDFSITDADNYEFIKLFYNSGNKYTKIGNISIQGGALSGATTGSFSGEISAASFTSGGNAVLHAGNYSSYTLPLSGGVLTTSGVSPLAVNSTHATANEIDIYFRLSGVNKGAIGFYGGWASPSMYIQDLVNGHTLRISQDGNARVNENIVIHAGNIGSQSVSYATNSDKLDGLHSTAFSQEFHYGTTAGNSGWYKINILSATSWMLSFTIRIYQNYQYYDVVISGYNYGANYWYSPQATMISSTASTIQVKFGYDSAYNLWVAIPAGAYTGITICNVNNGYTQVSDWSSKFSITNMATLTGTEQVTITAKRPLIYDENAIGTQQALTFNNAGEGNSSGSTFNGSAARTISYNSIGAAATNQTMYIGTTALAINRASASLSLTGVNIDGNSGSASKLYKQANWAAGNGNYRIPWWDTTGDAAGNFNQYSTSTLYFQPANGALFATSFNGALNGNATSATNASYLIHGIGFLDHPGNSKVGFAYAITNPQSGLFPAVDNSNAVLNINRHPGEYNSQLGFSSNGNLYYRSFSAAAINTTQPWKTVLDSSNFSSYALSLSGGVINGHIGQGALISRPNVVWGASGGTGAVVIKLPGNTGNYGMIHCVIDIYEYNSNNVSTVIVGGHNWNGQWYNYGAQVIGYTDKQVRLGAKDGQYCIIIGTGSSTWSYGQVVLRKIQNGAYYSGNMNLTGTYTIGIESDTYSWVSGDLRGLRTAGVMTADGGNSSQWNTAYGWGNHASAGYALASSLSNYSLTSHTHSYITSTRYDSGDPKPNQLTVGLSFQFSYPDGGWYNAINMRSYSDPNYLSTQIVSSANNPGSDTGYSFSLKYREGRNATWLGWKTILDSDNFSSYASTLGHTHTSLSNISAPADSLTTSITTWGGSYFMLGSSDLGKYQSYSSVYNFGFNGSARAFQIMNRTSQLFWRGIDDSNGDFNEFIHSGNIGSQSVNYAANSSKLYSTDSTYAYGSAAPYYMYMTYVAPYWYLQVSPATPANVRVAYSDSSGSATTSGTCSGNATSSTLNYVNEYNSTTVMRVLGSHNGINSNGNIYSTAKITMRMDTGTIYATTFSGALSGNATTASSAALVTHNSGRTDAAYYNVGWFTGASSPAYSCNAVQIQSSTGTLKATTFSGALSGNASSATYAGYVTNSLILKFDTGIVQGTDLYTFNGSAEKTIDFKAGSNVTLTKSSGSVTISALDYMVGRNTVTTLASLPIDKRSVLANVTAATSLSLASTLPEGQILTIKVYNTSGSSITQPLPTESPFESKKIDGSNLSSITIAVGGSVEISIWSINNKYIIKTDG